MMSESFRRLQSRKRPKRKTSSGSSSPGSSSPGSSSQTEITYSKKKSTCITKSDKEFTFCKERVTSRIDKFFYTFRTVHTAYSHIYILFTTLRGVKFLVDKILEDESKSDFFAIANIRMKAIRKFVEENVSLSSEDENSLLREVWLHPCFYRSLAAAIDYNDDIVDTIMDCRTQGSVPDRINLMVADISFEPSVKGLRKPTSPSTFLRLFLSILVGYWADESLFRELDQKMEKDVFGPQLDFIAKMKARALERAGKKIEIEKFSYTIEDINDAKNMEPLRKQMVERYATREDRDIEAILGKLELYDLLTMTDGPLRYEGMKVEIDIQVINGSHCGVSINIIPK